MGTNSNMRKSRWQNACICVSARGGLNFEEREGVGDDNSECGVEWKGRRQGVMERHVAERGGCGGQVANVEWEGTQETVQREVGTGTAAQSWGVVGVL